MSKNEEKAHAMLNRWVAMKKELNSRAKEKRPSLSTECNNLQDCERWRNQIIKEITKKVADIQNASLGEYKIRELNDEINKHFREKGHWEDRIKELGGPDYKKIAPKAIDAEGYELPGAGGYKYWGAAKDLPGVRELFTVDVPNAPKKSLTELYRKVNFEYYGFKDEEDGKLLEDEKAAEDILLKEYNIELEETEALDPAKKQKIDETTQIKVPNVRHEIFDDQDFVLFKHLHCPDHSFTSQVSQPTEEELERSILEKKKKQMIKMLNLEGLEEFKSTSHEKKIDEI